MQDPIILYIPEADSLAHALSDWLDNRAILTPIHGEKGLNEAFADLPLNSEVYTFLPDSLMIVALNAAEEMTLWPLPWEGNPHTRSGLLLESNWQAQMQRWQTEQPGALTQLPCANARWLLNRISIGTALQPPDTRLLDKLKWGIKRLRHARLRPFTLTTAKGQQIPLAALNIQMGDSAAICNRFNHLCTEAQMQTGRVTTLVFAPQSIVQFFNLALRRWLPGKTTALPQGVGMVRSQQLQLSSDRPFPYRIDHETFMDTQLDIAYTPLPCRLMPGRALMQDTTERDTLRLDGVPTGEEAVAFYRERPLPLFPHAGENAFAELFAQIRQGARFDAPFGVLLVLSVLLATLGLFQNSAPVIIGAMILAPLMAPIVSLSMGLIRLDGRLLRQSARTVALGTLLSIALAALFTWLMPFSHLTEQMASRTHPTLLDLGVAILSGLAAAYAYSREEVAKSLAGVAIAVALVPPLAVAGIGLGWGDWPMFQGAFLLFLANLVGILVASGFLFYVLGFSSLRTARTAMLYKLALLLAIALPLGLATHTLLEEERLYQKLNELKVIKWQQHRLTVQVTGVRIDQDQPVVQVRIAVPYNVDEQARAQIARHLQQKIGADVSLVIDFRTVYPAESNL